MIYCAEKWLVSAWPRSFYQVGMNMRKIATITLLVLSSFAANNVAPSKAELDSMYDRAFREFNANNYSQALKELDLIDARQPDVAESQNLRGVILMREQKYDEAEKALQKAIASDPKFWNAKFNFAEIPFIQKNWAEARNRFQAMLFGNGLDLQGEALQLIQYKILLTYLLEGKENMVDSIMAKLELAPDTPAVHYANAAMAFQRKNEAEAKDWVAKAEKNFSPQLNKLFAESLYEVGWMQKPTGQTRPALELTSAADRAAKAKAFARSKFEQAEQAFQQRDLTAARKTIDEADAADPNQAAYINLRGEILLAQKDFDGAEAAFKQAQKADPKFKEAQYNLAQIPFKKKEYAKARERFEALFSSTPAPGGDKDQAAQLIKFKIYLTLLLEGKDSRAQKMMEQFQFTGDTPALYYAQAAWEFKHNNPTKANDWVTSARKIYAPAMNMVFADAFYDLGWLQNAAAPAQSSAELAKADSTPSVEPTAIPGAALASNTAKQPAQKSAIKEAAVPGMEATTERSPAAVAQAAPNTDNKAVPSPAAALSPSVETPVAAAGSPAESRTALPRESQPTPAASQAPVVGMAADKPAPAPKEAPAASPVENAAPDVAATSVSATPATVLAPAKVREWSQPTVAERIERFVDPHALLVGAMLLAGIAILASVAIPALRRRAAKAPAYLFAGAAPAVPKFAAASAGDLQEQLATRTNLAGGPRQVSLQLRASEPSLRRAAVPFTQTNRPFGSGPGAPSAGVGTPLEQNMPAAAAAVAEEPQVAEPTEPVTEVSAPEPQQNAAFEVTDLADVTKATGEAPAESIAAETTATDSFVEEPTFAAQSPAPSVIEAIEPAQSWAAEPRTEEVAPSVAAPQLVSHGFAPEPDPEPAVAEVPAPVEAASEIAAPQFEAAPEEIQPEHFVPESTSAFAELEPQPEPIGQGQPVPHLIPASSTDGDVEPEHPGQPQQSRFGKLIAAGAAIAGVGALRRAGQPQMQPEPQPALQPLAPEPVSNESTVSEPLTQQPTPTEIMPPTTPQTPAPAIRTAPQAPMTGGAAQGQSQPQSAGGMQTAVQLSFSFEIAAMQLTPSFKMGALQLRPTSRIVSMRLAPSQHPQPAMNLQVTFEIANVQLTGNAIGTIRLTPSQQQRPNVTGSPSFNIAGLQLMSGEQNAGLQLTPGQGQAAVQVTGRYQIATVEFSPSFEIAALVLNSTSRQVSVQLPGSTQSPIESAPVFDIANVQLGGHGEIGMMQLNAPGGGAAAPRPA